MTVPQTDTRGWGENPKALELILAKELGKMAPYLRYKGCLSRVTVKRARKGLSEMSQATV